VFKDTPCAVPSVIKCGPVIAPGRVFCSQQPETEELRKPAAGATICFAVCRERRDYVKCSQEKLRVSGGELGDERFRECIRRERTGAFGRGKGIVPCPITRLLAKTGTIELKMTQAPPKNSGNVMR